MDTEQNEPADTDLQKLFAGIAPAAGFEDRLVDAVRRHRRMRLAIPPQTSKAAIAAAAVIAVGTVGYYGNRAISAKLNTPQTATAIGAGEAISSDLRTHPLDGQNVLYGDGHSEWQSSVFSGTQHDNIYTGQLVNQPQYPFHANGDNAKKPPVLDAQDSILSPEANHDSRSTDKEAARVPSNAPAIYDSYQTSALPKVGKDIDSTSFYYRASDAADDTRTKTGEGSLTLKGVNGYNGGTAISSGTLTMGGQTLSTKFDSGLLVAADAPANVAADDTKAFAAEGQKQVDQKGGKPPVLNSLSSIDPSVDDAKWGEEKKGGQVSLSAPPTTAPADDRKIIRTGTMEFEVDRFDTAQLEITKIVGELGGFVGATDSTKLPNGKVRGSICVRVPPERLDTLVLSLRALGDLKAEQITADDITKEYTDLESELAADRSMEQRLLQLINDGNGSIKDLLAAENELGEWRGKIEKAEGMIRYYNGQVALSTLTITLSERDIHTPATAVETETADVGIEADDVEKARDSALKAIDDAKGRIVEAELKRYDAGQLAARLVADVPPDSAGAVIDQLKLLGKVARLEVHRQQNSTDGTAPVTGDTPLKTERKPTRLLISIYNLANVAPRKTTNVSLAANDVEAAYKALTEAAKSNGGRVVTSSLDRGDAVKATGSLVLEFPPDKFEAAMTALHAQGDVLKLALTENPDTQNSTEAKAGLTVQLVSLASVQPRETVRQTLAATDVPAAYQAILDAVNSSTVTITSGGVTVSETVPNSHGRVLSAQLNEQDRQNVTADLQLEIPRSALADFDKALAAAGGTIARTSNRSPDVQDTVDSKLAVNLTITSSDHLAPRETTRLQIEVGDVDKSAADAQAAAIAAGGRVTESTVTRDHGKGLARIILDLPLDKSSDVLRQVRDEGTVRGIDASRDPQAPAGALAHAQIFVEFTTGEAIVADETGPWASIRQGLSTSISGLLWSLQWVIVGLCLIGPWAGIGWIISRLWRRRRVATNAER